MRNLNCRAEAAGVLGGFLAMAAIALSGCAPAPTAAPMGQSCTSDHPRVGQSAQLQTYSHDVSGVARVVDDCTIVIENFTYDGGGPNVRVYGGTDRTFQTFITLSPHIGRLGGYENETLTVNLPDGVTLDDIAAISIWCVDFDINFGDGVFE